MLHVGEYFGFEYSAERVAPLGASLLLTRTCWLARP